MARSTHPTLSFNAKSSIGTPRHRKRRRTDITVENQSPISDHSMNTSSGDVGEGNAGRLTQMGMRGDGLGRRTSQNSQEPRPSLLPTPGPSSTNLLPLVTKKKPTPPSSHSSFTAIQMASHVGTITEQLHIADTLFRARPESCCFFVCS
jgi:hypothetical protein